MDKTEKKIIDIIKNILEDESKKTTAVASELTLRENLGLSSLDIFELVGETEEIFPVHINESELSSVETVGDFISLVKSKISGEHYERVD